MLALHDSSFYTNADLDRLRKENEQLRKALMAQEELRVYSNRFSNISRSWRRKKSD